MSEIQSSGSVDFTNPETPDSGILADFDAQKEAAAQLQEIEAIQRAHETVQMQLAEVSAKDYWAARSQNNRHSQPAQTGYRHHVRPWDEREVRRKERYQQERHKNCWLTPYYVPPAPPETGSFARGKWRDEGFVSGFFRMLGLL
jgi:hypothetical protein